MMLIRIFKCIILLYPILTYAETNELASAINGILESSEEIKRLNVAIKVNDLQTGEEIYSINQYKSMIPASNTKSFTAYAALKYLTPNFTYSTDILFNKNQISSKNVLSGNLYIKFSGDPSLTRQEFAKLISKLHFYNIKTINGDVIIDDSIFDQNYQAPGWPWDDGKFCFAAPTSAIVINKNCFYLDLSPGVNKGDIARLSNYSKYFITMKNDIVTAKHKNCLPELAVHPDNKYHLTGCIDLNASPVHLSIAYQDPRLMIKDLVNKLLSKQNIKVNGKILFNTTPKEYNAMIRHESKNLGDLVQDMMKNSDNLAADNFTKTLGALYYNTQGSFDNGTKAISKILSDTGIDFKQISIYDGSGGSRYNLVAADHLVQLYTSAYHNNKIFPYFYNSLPILGLDGTLKERFSSSILTGKVHAKTGMMKGVSVLSGYLDKENGKTLVFAIIINGYASKNILNELINSILVELAK